MSNNNQIRYAIYARKSTEEKSRQILSLGAQLDFANQVKDDFGLKVVKTFVESKSASKPDNRPLFLELMKSIEMGKINGIICWQIDRLTRNPKESGILQQFLIEEKIKEIRTNSRIFTPDDNIIAVSVETAVGAEFIQGLKKNVNRGMRAKNKKGGYCSMAPQGYYNDRLEKTVLMDHENNRAELLRKAFDLYLTGNYSVPEVVQILNCEWGYMSRKRGKQGGRPMIPQSFYKILVNPFYMGKMRDLSHPELDQLVDGNWEPMITEEEYFRIQDILCTNDAGTPRNQRARIATSAKHYELKGILRCGECGFSITAETRNKHLKNGTPIGYTYYHCTHKNKNCTQKGGVREEDLRRQIDDLLEEYRIDPILYQWGLEIIEDIQTKEIIERNDIKKSQQASIDTLKKRLHNLIKMAADEDLSHTEFEEMASPIRKTISDLERAKKSITEKDKNWYELVGRTLKILCDPTGEFNDANFAGEKREILQVIGYNQVLKDKKVSLTPYEWVKIIKESSKNLENENGMVITDSDRCKKGSNDPKFKTWCA